MNVSVQMNLGVDDPPPSMTPQEMLVALGGDPAKDSINVSVSASSHPPIEPPPEPKELP